MIDGFTRAELMDMVVRQMGTIHYLQTQIDEALNAITNEAPDLAWRKLLDAQERFHAPTE
jgi:uncharacterized membrane protein